MFYVPDSRSCGTVIKRLSERERQSGTKQKRENLLAIEEFDRSLLPGSWNSIPGDITTLNTNATTTSNPTQTAIYFVSLNFLGKNGLWSMEKG